MSQPNRVEHQLTDKGYVPVYTTAVVEQPWADYTATDHEVWATLFKRQREILPGRASKEFLAQQESQDEKQWALNFAGAVFDTQGRKASRYSVVAQTVIAQAQLTRFAVVSLLS